MFNIDIYENSILFGVFVFLFGISIGSFLNVAALRGLTGEDFVFSRSKCPKCSHKLAWYDNIPILSYIMLKAHCRYCNCKISIQYPIVEFITGVLFLFAYIKFGITIKTLILILISSLSILIAITDIKEQVVLSYHVYAFVFSGLLYNIFGYNCNIIESVIFGILGFIVFEIISRCGKFLTKNESRIFGDGDSIIVAGLGTIFGSKILLAIILAIILDVIFIIPYMLYNKFIKKDYKQFWILLIATIFCSILAVLYFIDIYKYTFAPFVVIPVSLVLLWCAFEILHSLKYKEPEKSSYIPFGPPLVLSTLIMLFL